MGFPLMHSTALASTLFSNVRQRVLGLLFGQPDRTFYGSELIRLAHSGTGAVQRELQRLEKSGLVSVTRVGNQKHYRANPRSPIFEELRSLVLKTMGVVEPIREALAAHVDRIRAAFIYGSVAKGEDRASSDVDVMVIGDDLTYSDFFTGLQEAERLLKRPINPNFVDPDGWKRKLASGSPFFTKINAQPKIFIFGSQDDLSA
jgi:predicted nucleotidyltransferase